MSDLKVFGDATIRGGFTVGSALSYNFNIDKLTGDATLTGSLNVEGKTNFSKGKFTKLSVGATDILDTDPYIFYVEGDTRIRGNLIVNGTTTVVDTNINTSEQLLITNDGSAPCMVVNQLGNDNIAVFKKNGFNKVFIDVDGNLNILGTLYVNGGDIVKDNISSSTQWTTTGNDIYYNLGNIGLGTSTPTCKLEVNGILKVTNNTVSTSKTTGSVIISGGLGVANAIYTDTINVVNNIASTSKTTGALIVSGGVGINGAMYINNININGNIPSTNINSGSLIVTGGIGISGAMNINNVIINGNIVSTNTSSGSLIVNGGVGISGSINVNSINNNKFSKNL
jgi:hypothetical protein